MFCALCAFCDIPEFPNNELIPLKNPIDKRCILSWTLEAPSVSAPMLWEVISSLAEDSEISFSCAAVQPCMSYGIYLVFMQYLNSVCSIYIVQSSIYVVFMYSFKPLPSYFAISSSKSSANTVFPVREFFTSLPLWAEYLTNGKKWRKLTKIDKNWLPWPRKRVVTNVWKLPQMHFLKHLYLNLS